MHVFTPHPTPPHPTPPLHASYMNVITPHPTPPLPPLGELPPPRVYIYISGWWFGTFFHILGIIIPTD